MKNRPDGTQDRANEERYFTDLIRLFGQMVRLPLTAFVYSMELFIRTMKEMQNITDQGIDAVVSGVALPDKGDLKSDAIASATSGANQDSAETILKEEKKMSESDLSNDRVKVVEYYILSIKPDYEHVLGDPIDKHEHESGAAETGEYRREGRRHFPRVKVFTDNMTGEDFASWVIADYFQDRDHESLAHKDKKYLRVCYDVICTFAAEDAQYDREEVQVLRQIRDVLAAKPPKEAYASSGGKPPKG